MITAEVIFWTTDIKSLHTVLPCVPRIGDLISFPVGLVKWNDSEDDMETDFKIWEIEWKFTKTAIRYHCRLDKLLIKVERY